MAEIQAYPEFVARFYDVVYNEIRTGVDDQYYIRKIKETDGPVLEIGVGTGRLFQEALKTGADIYGLDLSPAMIAILKKKLPKSQHRRLFVQDVVSFALEKKFDLIIAPFRVFSHIIDTENQLRALNQIHHHLIPGGYLIFDLFIPNLKLLLKGLKKTVDFDGEYKPGLKVRRATAMEADLINQISHVHMTFSWENGGHPISKTWNFPMRYYFRYELEHLIHRSKLKLVKIFGDFDENSLCADSREFIVVCQQEN